MSLIEMLVTIVLVTIGLIGLLGLLSQVRQFSTDAEDRSRAAMLANDLAAQMLLNHSVTLPAGFLAAWNASVADVTANPQSGLKAGAATAVAAPDGDSLETGAENVATIVITWQSINNAQHSYTTKVVVP